jgi:hypothetical protein
MKHQTATVPGGAETVSLTGNGRFMGVLFGAFFDKSPNFASF